MPSLQTELFGDDLKWMGQRVWRIPDLTVSSVIDFLPVFERRAFGANEYLDLIVRKPCGKDTREVPVGSVSKRYFLIQHRQLVQEVSTGLSELGIDPDGVPAELWISDYGERIRMRFHVAQRPFDPGDGHNLVLSAECFNSVDTSCALEIRMSWLRLICMNGMTTHEEAALRKVHDSIWMNRTEPAEFIRDQLALGDAYFQEIQEMMRSQVSVDQIIWWVNNCVAKKWNSGAAARVYHICRTGFDGAPARPPKGAQACFRPVSSDIPVPGACAPVKNLYHVAQVLSWVAAHRSNVEDQIEWSRHIGGLIGELRRQ